MSGEPKLELNADEFYQAALAFIPVTEDQRTARTTARDDSNHYHGKWGGDEMGQAFYKNYAPLRSGALRNAKDFVTAFDQFRHAYVDARNEFVKQDDANGELQARIGEEITTEGGDTMTVQSGQKLSFDGQETFETPEEIADDLNAIEDAQDEAGEDAEEDYS